MKRWIPTLTLFLALGVFRAANAQITEVSPAQIDLSLGVGVSSEEVVTITFLPLCVRPFDIDVRASDPGADVVNLSGIIENTCGGDVSSFVVRITGDGVDRSFDLEFVAPETGNVLDTIPVTIDSEGLPAPAKESSGERSNVLSCAFECRGSQSYPGWWAITSLSLENPGAGPVSAGVAIIDGQQNFIAQSRVELGANDLDELHLCRSLQAQGIAQPLAGLVQIFLPEPTGAVYGWMKDAIGRFPAQLAEPYLIPPSSMAKSECKVVPPSVKTAVQIQRELVLGNVPDIPMLLINGTSDP